MNVKKSFNFVLMLVMLASVMGGISAPVKAAPEISGDYMPGEVIVTYAEDTPAAAVSGAVQGLAAAVNADVVKVDTGMALLRFAADADVPAMVELVKGYADVVAAEPNYIYSIPQDIASNGPSAAQAEMRLNTLDAPAVSADGRPIASAEVVTFSAEQLAEMKDAQVIDGKITAVPQWPSEQGDAWHFWRTDNYLIWNNTSASPRVCVVDTGADVNHPDLKGRVLNGYDYVYMDSVANDDNGHGTHVAGIIAAKGNNGIGTALGMSRSLVYAVKALDYDGNGTAFDIAQGIRWCGANSYVKVINLSLGSPSPSYTIYNALYYAIKTKGKFVAAAAGNTGSTAYNYPAAFAVSSVPAPAGATGAPTNMIYQALVSVGASTDEMVYVDTNNDGAAESYSNCWASFSNYGTWVQMLAPGEDIYSTLPVSYPFIKQGDGYSPGYDTMSGTSMATPIVAAAAARIWSIYPTKTNSLIENQMWWYSFVPNTYEDPDNSFPGGARKFCWPNSMTASSSFLSFASTMNRGALQVQTADGSNGLVVPGAAVRVVTSSGSVKDSAITDTYGAAYLINIPTDGAAPLYSVQVSKSGYTTGYTTVLKNTAVPRAAIGTSHYLTVPMVASKYWAVLTNWISGVDIDNSLYTPATSPDPGSFSINTGLLGDRPFVRGFMDGGFAGHPPYNAQIIRNRPGTAYPYYYGYGSYTILARGFGMTNVQMNNAHPIVRVWYGGVVKKIIIKDDTCNASETVWLAGTIRTTVTEIDDCGTNILSPYAVDESAYSINGK